MKQKNFFHQLIESYLFVLLIALLGGIIFSSNTIFLAKYSTLFLGIIFFFSALKIDFKQTLGYLKDIKMLIIINFVMLIGLPIIVYYITLWIIPSLAIAFLILATMPCGMTTPLLSEICGGRQSLALVLTIMTSLLAPFTVPFMLKILAGTTITISFYAMFLALAKVIFIPFIIANIIKFFWYHEIKATFYTFKPVSIVLLGLLIMGIVAKQANNIIHGLQGKFLLYIVFLFVFFIIIHAISYFTIIWRDNKDRVTITVCMTYMNFTLAIYLSGKFFTDPNIIIPIILSVLPWSMLIVPLKFLVKKFNLI